MYCTAFCAISLCKVHGLERQTSPTLIMSHRDLSGGVLKVLESVWETQQYLQIWSMIGKQAKIRRICHNPVIYRAAFKTFARVKEDLSEERRPHPIAGLCWLSGNPASRLGLGSPPLLCLIPCCSRMWVSCEQSARKHPSICLLSTRVSTELDKVQGTSCSPSCTPKYFSGCRTQ